MSRRFMTGEAHPTLAFERQPLVEQPRRRPIGRLPWFAIGFLLGLFLAALVR